MSTVRKVPLRKCIGCNEMKTKRNDPRGENHRRNDCSGHNRKNERTRCLCLLSGMSGESNENKGLSRSLKAEIPSEVYEQLKEAFAKIEQSK